MSRYDTQIEGFSALKVLHDTNLNKLQVRFPHRLNNTAQRDKQCLAILLRNDFEYWQGIGWVGTFTQDAMQQVRRIEQLLTEQPKNRVKHG